MRVSTLREGSWPRPEPAPVLAGAGPSQQQTEVGHGANATRLTLVIFSLAAGGAERVMSTLANAWSDDGRAVTLITIASEAEDFYPLRPAVRRIALDLALPSRTVVETARNTVRRVRSLRHTILASRPDAVISFVNTINNLTLLATRGLGVPVIVSERVDPTQRRIRRASQVLRRILYPRAGALVVQCNAIRPWADRFLERDRVSVIPNPLSGWASTDGADVAEPLAGCQARGKREPVVLAMGRLVRQKGFDLLLDAFARVLPDCPGWSLCILGEGEQRAFLEARAAELGIGDAVRLPGLIRDPEPLLRRAGLFVLPSRFEGFPNALLEAMGCGLPVISADCPSGPREIIRDGIDGLLVPPEDVPALASAMGRLMCDPETRTDLGTQAVAVRERFGIDAVMNAWDDLLARVVGEKR